MKVSFTRKRLVTAALVAGALIGSAGIANAVTDSSTPSAPVDTTQPAAGTSPVDNSNSDPAHEAGESAQREADETAGKAGGGGRDQSNKDPAHEAAESPERAAQEAANDAALANGSSASGDSSSATTG